MTNEEAINRLQKCIRNFQFLKMTGMATDIKGTDERIEAYELAIKALEKLEKYEEKKDEIRWTDKVTLDADGNIRDFNGNIYGADKRGDV